MGTNGFSVWNSNWNWYISLFFVNAGLCVPNSNDYSYPLHKTFNDYPVFDVRVVSRKFGRKNEKCVVLFQWKKRTQQKRSGQLWFDEMELTKLHSSIFITQLAESEMLNKFEYFEYVDLSITLFTSVNMANSSTLHIVHIHYKATEKTFNFGPKFSHNYYFHRYFSSRRTNIRRTNIRRTGCFKSLYYEMHHFRQVKAQRKGKKEISMSYKFTVFIWPHTQTA